MRVLLLFEGKHESAGALETLVRRLLGVSPEFKPKRFANLPSAHGKDVWRKKARFCLLEARKLECEAVVAVIDQDGDNSRVQQFNSAHEEGAHFEIKRAFGVAIRTFDAWMLADEQALTLALGQTIQRQEDPETIKDPKGRCQEFLDACGNPLAQSEMYARVAENADLETMEERCPRGFAPFAMRVRALRE